MEIKLGVSPKPDKKWRVTFPDMKHIDFGAAGMSDYTKHKDPVRMHRYVKRHSGMGETWGKRGLKSAGFWSRWLLWSKPSLGSAIKYMNTKFGIKIKRVRNGLRTK
jgi:hypothetical protein